MREPVLPFPELPLSKSPLEDEPVSQPVRPPDEAERRMALDPRRSFLVQAPAGSGKTYLLTQRFLRLLAEAERPDEIVAITFTNAAAAEMRNRVLDALERAESDDVAEDDADSLAGLARRAMERARLLGWQLLDQPNQLRITTIDAFCRGLALQSPLSWGVLSGLGGRLDTVEEPAELYRVAAARTLGRLEGPDAALRGSIEALLLWRDNNWKDVEGQIVDMLAQRNRWHQEFVFARDKDWAALRGLLEAPLRRDVRRKLEGLCRMLDRLPGFHDHALGLARSACETAGRSSPLSLAERAELPAGFADALDAEVLEDAVSAYGDLARFLLTAEGAWRKKGGLTVHYGFPATPTGRTAKERMAEFLEALAQEQGLETALGAFLKPMPVAYTEEEWELMRHCFAVLRVAAGELQLVFAETGSVDFTEIAQIALRILAPVDGYPSDFALRQAESIRHLLIDEFQDTSRNQHELVARLIAAWPDTEGRSCFCVGDPMQSIYGFREAEVELFERLRTHGFEMPDGPPFRLEFVQLRANFRTVPSLVEDLNGHFRRIFPGDEAANVIHFAPAEPMRPAVSDARAELHLGFTSSARVTPGDATDDARPEETRKAQSDALVGLIREKLEMVEAAKTHVGAKYRIAVLGRTRGPLVRIAEALRVAKIGFRAIDLVKLSERPEVLDVLALVRALMNPVDRTAWLGVLRAPWCGLSLEELHWLTSADDAEVQATPLPVLLASRLAQLYRDGLIGRGAFKAAARVGRVLAEAADGRPDAAGAALGTWVESVWKALGGEATVDDEQRQNLVRLWAALDGLPQGETDLMGAGLRSALDKLYALPDPAASSDFGVQLMTIHKSKGLEFEVVIVPDLDEKGREGEQAMISWLERGLAGSEDDEGQLTEFLIAPFQAKGTEAGAAKRWVDEVKRAREGEELRRVLYVAATRAREELHFFARPPFSVSKAAGGATTLCSPRGLLATAWPALKETIEARFTAWHAERPVAVETELETLAAAGGNVVAMPLPVHPTWVRRLPVDFEAPEFGMRRGLAAGGASVEMPGEGQSPLYARTEGGLRSRLEGTAIHAFLEHLARFRMRMSAADAAVAVEDEMPGIVAEIRSHGLALPAAQRLVQEALLVARRMLADPVGAWVLAPYPDAAAESRWTGLVHAGEADSLRTLRPDRVFPAAAPEALGLKSGAPVWWIIDYKTSHADSKDGAQQAFLESHRLQHIDQLAAYAQMLRGLRGHDPVFDGAEVEIRAGIYYPRLQLFDHWLA